MSMSYCVVKELKMVNFELGETKCENGMISMSRAWGNEIYYLSFFHHIMAVVC